MSARVAPLRGSTSRNPSPRQARVALLGTGVVGSAVWARLASWSGTQLGERLSLVHAANSRFAISNRDGIPADTRDLLMRNPPHASSLDAVEAVFAGHGPRIVIDATASEQVAERHAHWLSKGIHVVTACKLGQGTALSRWHAIQSARATGGTQYGDSATVGAGRVAQSSGGFWPSASTSTRWKVERSGSLRDADFSSSLERVCTSRMGTSAVMSRSARSSAVVSPACGEARTMP